MMKSDKGCKDSNGLMKQGNNNSFHLVILSLGEPLAPGWFELATDAMKASEARVN
jgi:hypothetical protein